MVGISTCYGRPDHVERNSGDLCFYLRVLSLKQYITLRLLHYFELKWKLFDIAELVQTSELHESLILSTLNIPIYPIFSTYMIYLPIHKRHHLHPKAVVYTYSLNIRLEHNWALAVTFHFKKTASIAFSTKWILCYHRSSVIRILNGLWASWLLNSLDCMCSSSNVSRVHVVHIKIHTGLAEKSRISRAWPPHCASTTTPELTFVVKSVSQFMSSSTTLTSVVIRLWIVVAVKGITAVQIFIRPPDFLGLHAPVNHSVSCTHSTLQTSHSNSL